MDGINYIKDYRIYEPVNDLKALECMLYHKHKGYSSTKRGNNQKAIAKRRKKNKNKKTHRK
jgi:hypothetical protein